MAIHKKIIIANQNARGPQAVSGEPVAAPDHVQPFMLESSQLKGRIVRLPQTLDAILSAHDYPLAVAALLAEALCLTTVLAGMLKYDGVFTLQIKGEGPVRTLVCDLTHDGDLRGYAGYDAEKLEALAEDDRDFLTLLEKGYLAFTVDQAASSDRYQGITVLSGTSLTDSIQHYFQQSEQIRTAFVSRVGQDEAGRWNGGALMLQQLALEGGQADRVLADDTEEAWRRSMMLMETVKPEEMLNGALPLNTLLYNLFHEEGVRVFDPLEVRNGCRCSRERILSVLDSLADADKREIAEDGVISVTCEFCNTSYRFPLELLLGE